MLFVFLYFFCIHKFFLQFFLKISPHHIHILYLVYSTKKKSMICYDIKNKTLISEIKNCHKGYITGLRHYADKINKIDIIMSMSNEENNIKLWNIRNMTCILDLLRINKIGLIK